MNIEKKVSTEKDYVKASLLISRVLLKKQGLGNRLKGKALKKLLSYLLADPDLGNKLELLDSGKSRKKYQSEGQDLVPVFFYPLESDWAHLSLISNATGFSRCYIFIFLMLLHFRKPKSVNGRTIPDIGNFPEIKIWRCCILVNKTLHLLTRKLII